MDSLDGYVSDDELAIAPLADVGWQVSTISWRDKTVNWDDFEIVVIRTTWDYQRYPDEYLEVLASINRTSAQLENPVDLVKWNLSKEYLREIAGRGVPIVPTIWNQYYDETSFREWLQLLASDEIIIKPTVSATAEHTYRLTQYDPALAALFADRRFMVQPFMPSIVSEGEYSLFYFNGEFSHAILKRPKPADFRVQEEHGGFISSVFPDAKMLEAGRKAAEQIGPQPLYARVDLVREAEGKFLLMELELIEPALYFRMDEQSPRRFAEALADRMDK